MRKKQFDEHRLLELAFDHFRRDGVQSATISNIAREANIQRGSIYHAYGDKETLFLAAYERYTETYLEGAAQALSDGSVEQRLNEFFAYAITNFCGETPAQICPTTRGLMELQSSATGALGERAKDAFERLIQDLLGLIKNAILQGAGPIERPEDANAKAEIVLAVVRGLVVLERASFSEAKLHKIAGDTVALLCAGDELEEKLFH